MVAIRSRSQSRTGETPRSLLPYGAIRGGGRRNEGTENWGRTLLVRLLRFVERFLRETAFEIVFRDTDNCLCGMAKGKHIVRGQVCLVGCTALSLAGDGNGGSVRVGWTKKT
jgi:hypothetical protein